MEIFIFCIILIELIGERNFYSSMKLFETYNNFNLTVYLLPQKYADKIELSKIKQKFKINLISCQYSNYLNRSLSASSYRCGCWRRQQIPASNNYKVCHLIKIANSLHQLQGCPQIHWRWYPSSFRPCKPLARSVWKAGHLYRPFRYLNF